MLLDRIGRTPVFAALALFLAGCQPTIAGTENRPRPTRGYILISIDTLRADRLSCYGHERKTSPFIDSLAARGALFENAIVQFPITTTSHMSILTGLYPAEHGVYPSNLGLSRDIETLPELFQRNGYRTAGFTEGGRMSRRFGFARGFDIYHDETAYLDTEVERTFARGAQFLGGLQPEDRFFLFLHTYAVHAPYAPPKAYRDLFWSGEAPQTLEPNGPNLNVLNAEGRGLPDEALLYYAALYDGSIRHADDVLKKFFEELRRLGLSEDVTVVITSDHGEEFLEHGKFSHTQVYHELNHVPLIIMHPDLPRSIRVSTLVQSIDLAPTLQDLAGLRPRSIPSGQSLVPCLFHEGCSIRSEAYAEVRMNGNWQRALYQKTPQGLYQLVRSQPRPERWVSRVAEFDTSEDRITFRAQSFSAPRRLRVNVDGETHDTVELGTEWQEIIVELPPSEKKRRITLASESCTVPPGIEDKMRWECRGFRTQGVDHLRLELFELTGDPESKRDRSLENEPALEILSQRLDGRSWSVRSAPQKIDLDNDLKARLHALGYAVP